MDLLKKFQNKWRGLTQSWGTDGMKRKLWNKEFAEGRWEFIENTSGDIIYPYIERYCNNGSILDLGCGSGNTGCELAFDKYREYMGVDISDVALQKATERSKDCNRAGKNRYEQSDITTYTPAQKYDLILFRESIYYVPRFKIKATLDRYVPFLKDDGVLIIRWHDRKAGEDILGLLGDSYRIIETNPAGDAGPMVVVFRAARKEAAVAGSH
jgi:SAM-dependent methyltransferase